MLCAPVGEPPIGVVYLQGRAKFQQVDRERAELFARQLAPLADHLVRRDDLERFDHTLDVSGRMRCAEIIGRSRALAHLLQSAATVAPLDVDVLITGPSGSGKSMLARTIANNSPRANGPFVELNCAAIPETLIESELFGAERGAHSTATRRVQGKVAAAEGGTLFLDEVGELSASAQAKLLQLISAREYHPLGSSTAIKADVRIMSATNANLSEKVAAEAVPRGPLLPHACRAARGSGTRAARAMTSPSWSSTSASEACKRHKLPVLGGIAPRAGRVSRGLVARSHAPARARGRGRGDPRARRARDDADEHHVFPKAPREAEAQTLSEATRQFQRRFVLEMLERNEWNVSETARAARSRAIASLQPDQRFRSQAGEWGGGSNNPT